MAKTARKIRHIISGFAGGFYSHFLVVLIADFLQSGILCLHLLL